MSAPEPPWVDFAGLVDDAALFPPVEVTLIAPVQRLAAAAVLLARDPRFELVGIEVPPSQLPISEVVRLIRETTDLAGTVPVSVEIARGVQASHTLDGGRRPARRDVRGPRSATGSRPGAAAVRHGEGAVHLVR